MLEEQLINIGTAVKTCRSAKRMTIKETAARVGISPIYFSKLEAGTTMLNLNILNRIGDVLGIPGSLIMFMGTKPEEGKLTDELHQKLSTLTLKLIMEDVDE